MKNKLVLLGALLGLVFTTGCQSTGSSEKSSENKKVLFVVTSHDSIPKAKIETGAYFGEIAHPYKVLTQAGIQVDFVSPKGGEVPLDGLDKMDKASKKLFNNSEFMMRLKTTMKPSEVKIESYDAIYFAGGHGTMFDFPNNKAFQKFIVKVYEKGGAVAAVCHGPASLVNVKLSNGKYLVDGKEVAAFTNDEEKAVKLASAMPFLLEDRLKLRGGKHVKAENFQPKVVVSERLITGQNPSSATGVGEKLRDLVLDR